MKKTKLLPGRFFQVQLAICLLSAVFLLGQPTNLLAQSKTESKKGNYGLATGGFKSQRQQTPPASINSNARPYQNDCFKSLAFTVKNYGYNKDGKFYSWGVKVVNHYTKAIQFKYKLFVGDDRKQAGTLTYFVGPGETYSNDYGTAKAIIVNSSSDKYEIEVSDVCFEGMDCSREHVECDLKKHASNVHDANKVDATPSAGDATVIPAQNFFDKTNTQQQIIDKLVSIMQENGFILQQTTKTSRTFDSFKAYFGSLRTNDGIDLEQVVIRQIKDPATRRKLRQILNCGSNTYTYTEEPNSYMEIMATP